ncbi:MAG: hypothetical protein Q9199_003800 [Rusavskia elegans]
MEKIEQAIDGVCYPNGLLPSRLSLKRISKKRIIPALESKHEYPLLQEDRAGSTTANVDQTDFGTIDIVDADEEPRVQVSAIDFCILRDVCSLIKQRSHKTFPQSPGLFDPLYPTGRNRVGDSEDPQTSSPASPPPTLLGRPPFRSRKRTIKPIKRIAKTEIVHTRNTLCPVDTLLDQEDLEADPVDRLERDNPLHKVVRVNDILPSSQWVSAISITDLIDTGAVPRICNKAKLKPMDLEDPKNKELRNALQKANDPKGRDDVLVRNAPDKGPTESASDSD